MNAYLFDFDGTLVDSVPVYTAGILSILDDKGISYPEDIVKMITPLGVPGTAKLFMELGVDMNFDELVEEMKVRMADGYFYRVPAKRNVEDVLLKLKEQGACLNILTASPHYTVDPCLERLGMQHLFTNVWSCDDFATTKANPEIYKMAAQRIGEKVENILFLDDNLNSCMTAKKAGMPVCGVYDPSSEEYVEQMKAATDYYINDFKELLELPLDK